MPASIELTAVLADTLIEMDQSDAACAYSRALTDSPFASTASLAEITRAAKADPYKIDPVFWTLAYRATGNPYFQRNAVVLYARNGNFSEACAIGLTDNILADDAYFHALLCYDSGFYERVFHYLDKSSVSGRSSPELALMADSAARMNDTPSARVFWISDITVNPSLSPLPYYNLSLTSDNSLEGRANLESCFGYFPAYYPAVVRYVRSIPLKTMSGPESPITLELEKKGFRSLENEEKLRNAPLDAKAARKVLDAALSRPEAAQDSRFVLEDFRFNQLNSVDAVRSASEMWKLLERKPGDPFIHSYAVWYFAFIRNFDACFALNREVISTPGPSVTSGVPDDAGAFYRGLEAAFRGDLVRSEEEFRIVANNEQDAWCALANIAKLHVKKNDFASAFDEISIAAGLAPDNKIKSELFYESAKILLESRENEKALHLLGYALEIDPSNYKAVLLIHELEAVK